jgi:hypothetical protein
VKTDQALKLASQLAIDWGLESWRRDTHAFASRPGNATATFWKRDVTLWFHDEDSQWSATHSLVGGYLQRYETPHEALVGLNLRMTAEARRAADRAAAAAEVLAELVGS